MKDLYSFTTAKQFLYLSTVLIFFESIQAYVLCKSAEINFENVIVFFSLWVVASYIQLKVVHSLVETFCCNAGLVEA